MLFPLVPFAPFGGPVQVLIGMDVETFTVVVAGTILRQEQALEMSVACSFWLRHVGVGDTSGRAAKSRLSWGRVVIDVAGIIRPNIVRGALWLCFNLVVMVIYDQGRVE